MFDKRIKHQALEECIKIQEEKIKNAQDTMSEFQKMANEYGAPRDRYDAFRSQLLRNRDLFAKQYQKALDELTLLEKINPEAISTEVEFGSVIITNTQRIFIAIGLGKIEIDGMDFFVVSTQVPVFKAIQGLKEKDSFTFNQNESRIEQLF